MEEKSRFERSLRTRNGEFVSLGAWNGETWTGETDCVSLRRCPGAVGVGSRPASPSDACR